MSVNINKYQEFAAKGILPAGKDKNLTLGFALGLAGEAGEVCDDIKKREYHGREIPIKHTIEELGDVMWYVANLCTQFNISIEEVLERNMIKLKERYPDEYSDK